MGTWHLIETLNPDVATVVSTDGEYKDWNSVARLFPKQASDLNAKLVRTVAQVRETLDRVDLTWTSEKSKELFRVVAIPVIGPFSEAHGIQLWTGSPGEDEGQPRPCSGVAWLLSDFMIHQTLQSGAMSGVDPKEWDPVATPAEYIHRSVQFDDELEFVKMAIEPTPGQSMNTQFSVRHDAGHIMQWQVVLRTNPDSDQPGWRVLFQDVSDVYPASSPTLAQVGLTEGLRGIGYHVALFHAQNGLLGLWISPAADWMEWQFTHLTGPVIDPADLETFKEATARLRAGSTEEFVTLGLRTRDLEYVKSSLRISPFKKENHEVDENLVLVQISTIEGQDPFA
nr:GAF domain-containing protein [Rhodococcus sp. 06-621-2]